VKNDRMFLLNTDIKRWLHKISIVRSQNTPQSTYSYTYKKYQIKSIEKKYENPKYDEIHHMRQQEMITTVRCDDRNNINKIRRKIEVKKYKTITNKWHAIKDKNNVQKFIKMKENTLCHASYRANPSNWWY